MEATCEICHERPPTEGFQLCYRCKGFDPLSDSKEIPAAERTPELCQTCGAPIEPYKIGKNTRTAGECRDCYYKRRYGPGWKPGGKTKDEKNAQCRAWKKAKKMREIEDENGNVETPSTPNDTGPPEMLDSIKDGQQEQAIMAKTVSGYLTIKGIKHLTIPFEGEDEFMYERIKTLSLKERRSMEQQVLYFLDRVVEV